jgi:hypothetical protein
VWSMSHTRHARAGYYHPNHPALIATPYSTQEVSNVKVLHGDILSLKTALRNVLSRQVILHLSPLGICSPPNAPTPIAHRSSLIAHRQSPITHRPSFTLLLSMPGARK